MASNGSSPRWLDAADYVDFERGLIPIDTSMSPEDDGQIRIGTTLAVLASVVNLGWASTQTRSRARSFGIFPAVAVRIRM